MLDRGMTFGVIRFVRAHVCVLWTWVACTALVFVVHRVDPRIAEGLVASSAAIPALLVAAAPRGARRWIMLAVVTAVAALALANAAYHRFFGDYIPLDMIRAGPELGTAIGYLPGLVRLADVAAAGFALAVSIAVLAAAGRRAAPGRGWTTLLPFFLCLLGAAPALYWAWSVAPSSINMARGGFLYMHLADARRMMRESALRDAPPPDELKRVVHFTRQRSREVGANDPWYGSAAGSNVLLIQVEALNDWAVDVEIDGQPVMPYVRALANRAVRFTEIYDNTRDGRSADADHMVMASQHPFVRGAVALIAPGFELLALPHVLEPQGYSRFSAHASAPRFSNASVRHAKYGISTALFEPALGERGRTGRMLDGVFLQRVAPLIERLREPFLAWLITLSMHGPHRELEPPLRKLALGQLEATPLGTYLQKASHTDDAIRSLVGALDAAGLMARTMLVLYGDHTESYEFDMREVRRLTGTENLPEDEVRLRLEKIPLLLAPPKEGGAGERIASVGSLIDVAPTLLHFMGIAAPRAFIGRSLVPYAPGFSARATGEVFSDDLTWAGGRCYSRARRALVAVSDCDALRTRAREELEISWAITRYELGMRLHDAAR